MHSAWNRNTTHKRVIINTNVLREFKSLPATNEHEIKQLDTKNMEIFDAVSKMVTYINVIHTFFSQVFVYYFHLLISGVRSLFIGHT